MSLDIRLDASQAERLAADLLGAQSVVLPEVRKTMSTAGLRMKDRMRREARRPGRLAGVERSITYDLVGQRDGFRVDVGPTFGNRSVGPLTQRQATGGGRGQGALAWIGYDGTARRGPLFPEPQAILDDEAEVTATHLSRILDEHLT